MLENLKRVIDERFSQRSEAAEALFPGMKSRDSNLSTLISSEPTVKFRRPTIDALKRVFPEYNTDWLLHNIEPMLVGQTDAQEKITTNPNITENDLMNRIENLTEQLNELREDKKMLMQDKEMLRKDKEEQAKRISKMEAELDSLRSRLGETQSKDRTG